MSRPRRALVVYALAVAVTACAGDNQGQFTAGGAPADGPAVAGADLLRLAQEAGRWIDASAVEVGGGIGWPADPSRAESTTSDLYGGSPGVVLYLLELYRVDGSFSWGGPAARGAEALAAALPTSADEVQDFGLYTGLSGRCLALLRASAVLDSALLRTSGDRCLDLVIAGADREPGWGAVTDIIGGWAGIGSFLLWAAEWRQRPDALAAARVAGDRLLSAGTRVPAGLEWPMAPDAPRLMPNFSHGTAGIAFFLARLYDATGDSRYLEGALAGGRYLLSIADTAGDVCLVYHHSPGGTDLHYLSWCHGPAGTGRTFFALWRSTGATEWLQWAHRSAAAILASGIPEQRTPGFWNNVGLCCGNAGVADFFLDLYSVTGEPEYLAFARRVVDDLIARGTRDDSGARWVQAEHRVRPDDVAAQTGWMQGAAGIGATLLHLRAVEAGTTPPAALPDNPFPRGSDRAAAAPPREALLPQ